MKYKDLELKVNVSSFNLELLKLTSLSFFTGIFLTFLMFNIIPIKKSDVIINILVTIFFIGITLTFVPRSLYPKLLLGYR